ncbi:MAG: hypothetical protein A2167_07090 [Planctomycetes bacterium RBG_13_46_10]|nr:MAG: hypothetical protein A2167_07090 [Planctomycetes bacterium RBG_13_46_10]
MKHNDNMEEKIKKKLNFTAGAKIRDRIFDDVLKAQENSKKTITALKEPNIWRIIMKSPITKLAAAAVIILAGVLSIIVWNKSIPTAYALEQTVQASHTVRYLHIKSFKPNEDEPKEFWIEFYEDGEVKNVRMHMPEWDSPEDGAKVTVWKENKAQVWFKKKKSLVTFSDKTIAANTLDFIEELDPKLVVERLYYAQQAQDQVKIEIDEPSNKAKPIVVTATCLPGSSRAGWRVVLFVDRATKLVTAIEFYKLKDGKYQYVELIEYYDYNQPIDAEMFSLDDDIPADVMQTDQTTQKIGLVQGDLTDKEIAVKVVREFYEALIAKDYAKAGQLYSGLPADKIREKWEELKVVRIISIGEPVPHPDPGVGGFQVPCKIEVERDGAKSIYEPYGPGVRPVHGQPDHWNIHGGVK